MKEETRNAALYLLLLGFTHEIKDADKVTMACQHAFTVWNDSDCPREQIQWHVIHWLRTYLDNLARHADPLTFKDELSDRTWYWSRKLNIDTSFKWTPPESWWYDTLALLSDPAT